jgi:hypothetical protein
VRLVAHEALTAEQRGDWRRLIALAHPSALADFRRSILFFLDPSNEETNDTRAMSLIFHVTSYEDLSRLSPDTLAVRYFAYKVFGLPHGSAGAARGIPVSRSVIGVVTSGDSLGFAMLRNAYPGLDTDSTVRYDHLTIRRLGGAWRIMLDGGLLETAGGWSFELNPLDSPEPPEYE